MKRTIVASLALVVTGAGLARGQGPAIGAAEPAPRPSVIRVQAPANPPAATVPIVPPATATAPEPEPITTPPAAAPTPVPPPPTVISAPVATQMPPSALSPYTTPPSAAQLSAERPVYSTSVLNDNIPWTAKGRRRCGSVYLDTPYLWLNADFSVSRMKEQNSVPLLTTAPVNSVNPGALGNLDTTVLFSGQDLQQQPYFGGRFSAGTWFDECQFFGGEVSYFFLGARDVDYAASASGIPGTQGLYLPFTNPLVGAGFPDAFPIADPRVANQLAGSASINSRTSFMGANIHALTSISRGMTFRVDGIVGFQWLGLNEEISVEENTRPVSTGIFLPLPNRGVFDQIRTSSNFYGADLGVRTHLENDCWSLDVTTKIAVGGNHNAIDNFGITGLTNLAGETTFFPGGRLVGPANSGSFSSDRFSVAPEMNATVGYQPRNWLRLTAGYNFLYWTRVVRPGPQIDQVINPAGVPSSLDFNRTTYVPPSPTVPFASSDIWVQSVTLGLQILY